MYVSLPVSPKLPITMPYDEPFRGKRHSDPRRAFLQYRKRDDARTALRMLDGRLQGRVGPSGETLYVGLSHPPAVHLNQTRRWVYDVEDMEKSGGGREEKSASRSLNREKYEDESHCENLSSYGQHGFPTAPGTS